MADMAPFEVILSLKKKNAELYDNKYLLQKNIYKMMK